MNEVTFTIPGTGDMESIYFQFKVVKETQRYQDNADTPTMIGGAHGLGMLFTNHKEHSMSYSGYAVYVCSSNIMENILKHFRLRKYIPYHYLATGL